MLLFWQIVVIFAAIVLVAAVAAIIGHFMVKRTKRLEAAFKEQHKGITYYDRPEFHLPLRVILQHIAVGFVGLVLLAGLIAVIASTGLYDTDDQQHCAPGTIYQQVDGKGSVTVQQDGVGWWCAPA